MYNDSGGSGVGSRFFASWLVEAPEYVVGQWAHGARGSFHERRSRLDRCCSLRMAFVKLTDWE